MFEREGRRGGAPSSSDLLVNVRDVTIYGGDGDDQIVGDLAGRAAAGETPQHLHLSSGETGRVMGGRPNLDRKRFGYGRLQGHRSPLRPGSRESRLTEFLP